jgi:hypothetical protein
VKSAIEIKIQILLAWKEPSLFDFAFFPVTGQRKNEEDKMRQAKRQERKGEEKRNNRKRSARCVLVCWHHINGKNWQSVWIKKAMSRP